MNTKDLFLFLFVLVWAFVLMMVITFGGLFCRQSFGGVWSSIVIDDCIGTYWSPTAPDHGGEGGLVPRVRDSSRVTTNNP